MTDLDLARQTLESGPFAFVLVRHGEILTSGTDHGVVELLAATDRLGERGRGASLADKVVGKAVALIAVHAGVRAIDTRLASQAAVDFCAAQGVALQARTVAPQILNRRGDGPCPMEHLTQPVTDPAEGIAKLRAFFAARRP